MSDLLTTTTMSHIECGKCGISFMVPKKWQEDRRGDHKSWYCPNGHQRHYPQESNEEKQRRFRGYAENRLQAERANHDQTKAELRETEARRRGEKAAKTRLKNRVGNGVCPCCNRTFVQLARHMKSQHPDYAEPTHA